MSEIISQEPTEIISQAESLALRKNLGLELSPWQTVWPFLQNILGLGFILLIWNASEGSDWCYGFAPFLAILMFRSFSILHEAAHASVSEKFWLNESVGVLSGGLAFMPFYSWKLNHSLHHYWAGNLDKDPVTYFITTYPKMSSFKKNTLNWIWQSWLPIMAVLQYLLFWALSLKELHQSKARLRKIVSLVMPWFVLGILIHLTSWGFILSAVFGYLFLVEVVNLPHHLKLPNYRGDTRLATWKQYQIARTCIYPQWMATWVTLNFNYHVEHHLFPDAPWFYLPKIQKEIQPLLGAAYNGDVYGRWILENKQKTILQVIQPDSSEETIDQGAA